MSNAYDVIGIGNAIVDVIFAASDEFLLEHAIAKSVMTLIDEFRAARLVAVAENAKESSGGSAANTMAGLASFGGRGSFIGKVKKDRLGFGFADDLGRIGVHFDTSMATDGPSTACCVIAVTPDGHRSMSTYLGACRELTPHDIVPAQIASGAVLYVEGYMWDDERSKMAIRKAIAAAKGAGRRVAFTLSDPFCVGRYRDEFLELMKSDIDILFANEEEAKALFEVQSFEPALQFARAWRGLAVMTRSEKGCVIADPSGGVHVQPAEPVAKVLDTTGAGDQFAAGFLYGLSQGRDLPVCARLGSIAAAEVISHYGARPQYPFKALAADAGL
ncbi:MAG TPA: adenosine kinase [Micropepsaceae bacterium]|nr:adenosine kinase [Micropepsaceae bacterium]